MKTVCSHCSVKLTISSELIGREVRCPECEYVFVTKLDSDAETAFKQPGSQQGAQTTSKENPKTRNTEKKPYTRKPESRPIETTTEAEHSESETISLWQLRVPEGTQYGPVPKQTLDGWVEEGRVDESCEVFDGRTVWQPAIDVYPELNTTGDPFFRECNRVPPSLLAHRGYTLVALSLLGCVIPFVSVMPVSLGTRDLNRMRRGEMDSSGRALTSAAQAIGMTATFIWIGAFAVLLLALMISALRSF